MSTGPTDTGDLHASDEQIQEEYKIWKKNSPFLYDLVITHSMEWPTLTCQWLPDRTTPADKDYTVQRLILGTHTDGAEPNSLLIAEVKLPSENTEVDARKFADNADDPITNQHNASSSSTDNTTEGQYGIRSATISVIQQIAHNGEVHRARYNPFNPNMIATKSPNADLYIFDRSKHSSKPDDPSQPSPDLVLTGHTDGGYGVSWNSLTNGLLVSGSDDSLCCTYDINAATKKGQQIDPLAVFKGHTDIVSDVQFHTHHTHLFGSVSDDKQLMIWDTRSDNRTKASHSIQAHNKEVNCLSFNPFAEHLVCTGSSDYNINLFDTRKLTEPVHTMTGHTDAVFRVEWSPFSADILMSASADRRIHIYDVSQIGVEQSEEEAIDGPPELLFVHGGHTDRVADISWNPNKHEEYTICSVADDNMCQIWTPAAEAMGLEDEDDEAESASESDEEVEEIKPSKKRSKVAFAEEEKVMSS